MAVYFTTKEGKSGMLDVAVYLRARNLVPYKVQDGNVLFTALDNSGKEGLFSVADWAVKNNYSVYKIDGFNTPMTAIDMPPLDLTRLDQSVWYMDGAKLDALREIYPQAAKLDDGRVVVLDKDGMWKTMWSENWAPDEPYSTYEDRIQTGQAVDTRTGMRSAGIAFLFGLSGVDPVVNKMGDIKPKSIEKMFHELCKNAPLETQYALSQLVEQTTGVDQWKIAAAMYHPEDLGYWLEHLSKKTTFDFRMEQADHAEVLVAALHKLAIKDFLDAMGALEKLDDTKSAVINMKEVAVEFLVMLNSMDVIRDISKVTGLDDYKEALKNGDIVDESEFPDMGSVFIKRLVTLLQYVMPMAKEKALMIARGKRGIKACTSILALIDKCIYALVDVPDSTARQKMFMALKSLQVRLETKLATTYHPIENKDGTKVNAFHQAKAVYTEKREIIYRMIQTPKEAWSKAFLGELRKEPNLEAFYDMLPPFFAKLLQSFVAMDVAYDMQPWIDTNYAARINDTFAMMQDTYGPPPPEFGYLASNSPRAALNIIDTLASASGMLLSMKDKERKEILRRPLLFAQLMKIIQTASVAREIGAVEILNKMGVNDSYASPSAQQIWRDPNEVQAEQDQLEADLTNFVNQQLQAEEQNRLAQEAQMAQAQAQPPAEGEEQALPEEQKGTKGQGSVPASAAPNGSAGGMEQMMMGMMGG